LAFLLPCPLSTHSQHSHLLPLQCPLPFVAAPISLGSKCPCLSSPPPPPPIVAQPTVAMAITPLPKDINHSVFDILNIFCHRWFINHDHLITNVLSATQDDNGHFIWVDFLPAFHTSLIKHMCTLLPPGYSVSHGKKSLFIFLLEVLTSEGLKLEVFWHAHKKCSQASQEGHLATQAFTPMSAPSAPPLCLSHHWCPVPSPHLWWHFLPRFCCQEAGMTCQWVLAWRH
jgi:hypothetical protein